MKESQAKRILEYMQKRGCITPDEADKLFACKRLAGRVHDLKAGGHKIITIMTDGVNRFGEKCRFARYVLNDAD